MQLRLNRRTDALDVVIEGVGAKPQLQQRLNGLIWEAKLTTRGQPGLLRGPQTLRLPELGIDSVSLNGGGDSYRLVVSAMQGQSLKDPVVSADGKNLILTFEGLGTPQLQTARLDLTTPGRVPQPRYAPPLRPRAVAPPLGDMAVGTMVLQNRSYVNVSGPPVTLTLNNAPAKDALLSMARLGGYGFVYMDDSQQSTSSSSSSGGGAARPVTMTFANESYARALNSLLLASGLQGKLDGRTLLVGSMVSGKTFGPQISKVYRLNQASASSAADYLASLGAQISKINTTSITTGAPASAGTAQISNEVSQTKSTLTNVETYGSAVGPLRGLTGTTDSRLQTITLVGDSRLVAVAEGYLKQIDLRQRQVAVKVQILNVDLTNDKSIDANFSAKLGNTFIVSENGKAFMNFGDYKPGNRSGTGLLGEGSVIAQPGVYDTSIPESENAFVEQKNVVPPYVEKLSEAYTVIDPDTGKVSIVEVPFINSDNQKEYVPDPNPNAESQLVTIYDELGRPVFVPSSSPADNPRDNGFAYPQNSVYGFLEAVIDSTSAKTLAQPTLLVQEGQEAKVETGTSVITSVSTTEASNGSTQYQYKRENAGLTLKVKVSKVDDNGFISLNIDPQISVPIPAGENNGVDIYNISGRSLSSGSIRLRDRQTLVLTGVIQDQDKEVARKWPILGDLPLIGHLFRSSGSSRSKNELVILVTPMIVDDEVGGSYGYGYRPSTKEARELMGPG
jgi:type IV pilus assembly protein PilQ